MKKMSRAALVAVLALVASLLMAPAAPLAAAAPAGSISGTITSSADLPSDVLEASVRVYRRDAEGVFRLENAYTRVVGQRYTVPAQSAGTYRVEVHLDEWGVAMRAPATVTVGQGAAVTGADVVLDPQPRVSGRITMEDFELDTLQEGRPLYVVALARVAGEWKPVGSVDRLTYGDPALRIHRDGTFALAVEGPHPVVRLKFVQPHCGELSEQLSCGLGLAPEVVTTFWDGTTRGASTVDAAVDIDVSAGSVVGRDVSMRRSQQMRFTKEPTITGSLVPGQVLTAQPGTYSPAPTAVAYTWMAAHLRGNASFKVVGTGRTFRVPAGFANHAVRVIVRPSRAGYEAPALSTQERIKSPSRVGLKAKAGKRKATVAVTITSPEHRSTSLNGRVSIYAKGKRIKTVTVRRGQATIAIAKQKKGKRTYTVRYSGSWITTPSQRSIRIAIR
ncbi:hypothetical protein [Aeromicrobium sp. HA]|uniref:hypothetical protein n=1 Tax=Aeromicrobium sp. HA TaxID=3009077 RepID=UPI0022B07A5C|nr:hypothetical protein [Aeromicrobium sp. HA]